ncbi:outer membrane beta-barrel protein [Undibacterium cyanobacteriorum]|uniref:Outer membrane beta-barrel protein n=1 Tax=Undibacterium cyanobacteriorum TaxID=3073561 RepID=A0ABY9RL94_9BURK|nr:outer membrane beta-barrel protein [Undibacterium sp. 20NA77.5]WMW81604.1 outer membrane beta-barrel protein [Undibacterium sp. 20NA77.5]
MLKKSLLVGAVSLAAMLASGVASAQNVYVGGTVGQAKWNDDCKAVSKCDTKSNAFKLIGGYNFDKNFAFETSLFSLGKITASAPLGNAIASAEVKASGIDFAGVAKADFTDEFGGFVKLGVSRVTTSAKGNVGNLLGFSDDTTSTQPVGALGLTYKVSKDLALRGEFETRRVKLGSEKENVNTFSVGMQYSF